MKWLETATIVVLQVVILHENVMAEDIPPTCAWGEPTDTGTGGPIVRDLRTPTPLVIPGSYTVTNCVTPTSITNYASAYYKAQTYLADPVTYVFSGISGTSSVMYTFENFLVTALTPGDIIPILTLAIYPSTTATGTWLYFTPEFGSALIDRFEVPIDITLTNGPNDTPPPYTRPPAMITSQPIPSFPLPGPRITLGAFNSSSSGYINGTMSDDEDELLTGGQIGGIVGGAMAGLIIITCILAYVYLRMDRKQHPRTLLQDPAPGELLTGGGTAVYNRRMYNVEGPKQCSGDDVYELSSVISRDEDVSHPRVTLRYE